MKLFSALTYRRALSNVKARKFNGARYRIGKRPASFLKSPNLNMKVFQIRKKYQKMRQKWRTSWSALMADAKPLSADVSNGALTFLSLDRFSLRSMNTM